MIEVLTEQAPSAYLAYLQEQGISYIFAGKRRLNCILLLENRNDEQKYAVVAAQENFDKF